MGVEFGNGKLDGGEKTNIRILIGKSEMQKPPKTSITCAEIIGGQDGEKWCDNAHRNDSPKQFGVMS